MSLERGLIVDDLSHLHSFWLLDYAAPAFAAWLTFVELAQAVFTVVIRNDEARAGVGRFGGLHFVSDLLLALLTAGRVDNCVLEKFIILTS